jgi:hypothetical protein
VDEIIGLAAALKSLFYVALDHAVGKDRIALGNENEVAQKKQVYPPETYVDP